MGTAVSTNDGWKVLDVRDIRDVEGAGRLNGAPGQRGGLGRGGAATVRVGSDVRRYLLGGCRPPHPGAPVWLSRDRLREAEVVSPGGRILTASASGTGRKFDCGCGNFAVVARFIVRAHPLAGVIAGSIDVDEPVSQ